MKHPPYGLCADVHAHNWSAFAAIDSEGRNTRLMAIVNEITHCAAATRAAGGTYVVIAGDLFHVRGKVEPSVFNPVRDAITHEKGIVFIIIPGNHDLQDRETTRLGSAVNMLAELENVLLVHERFLAPVNPFVFVPWQPTPALYMQALADAAEQLSAHRHAMDLICHIGIDGTLSSMPDHGVAAEQLATLGFHRVFSGHYHHHKNFGFGNGVWSIGATTHQTWGDLGTKAGFLIVHDDHVDFHASHAPSFIELTGSEDPEEVPLLVEGHYVRVRLGTATNAEREEIREMMLKAGARGVLIDAQPASGVVSRAGASAKSLTSLDASVLSYVDEKEMPPPVKSLVTDILSKARTAA